MTMTWGEIVGARVAAFGNAHQEAVELLRYELHHSGLGITKERREAIFAEWRCLLDELDGQYRLIVADVPGMNRHDRQKVKKMWRKIVDANRKVMTVTRSALSKVNFDDVIDDVLLDELGDLLAPQPND